MTIKRLILSLLLATVLVSIFSTTCTAVDTPRPGYETLPPIERLLAEFGHTTGLYAFLFPKNLVEFL